jgi:polysaccharide export outer membrane protein
MFWGIRTIRTIQTIQSHSIHSIHLIPIIQAVLHDKEERAGRNSMHVGKSSLHCALGLLLLSGGCTSTMQTSLQGDNLFAASAGEEERLARLWTQRTQEGPPLDWPLGSGDVLEISVTPVTEVQNYVVRISGEGDIALPLIGSVPANGLSEAALSQEIHRRFAETFVRDPQVHIFVREYRSRLVAVVGAVEKPGTYSLTAGSGTILDLVSQAGGATKDGAPRVLFFPAELYAGGAPVQVAASSSVQLDTGPIVSALPSLTQNTEPLVINIDDVEKERVHRYLTLPVRPGDIIMVPAAGEVLVDGWVERPGSYKITPSLTVLGAITAAGGLQFAANSRQVKISRSGKQKEKMSILADLEKIKRGQAPDISVQEGDVIEVASSTLKLAPYGIYSMLSNMLRLGATIY